MYSIINKQDITMSGELGEVEIKLTELVDEVFRTYPKQLD